jgi:hypothetical protein
VTGFAAVVDFSFDTHLGSIMVMMNKHNSKTIKKVVEVSNVLQCQIREYKKIIDKKKYLNNVLDIESGPLNEWGDPPFSKNIEEIEDDEDEWE